MSSDLKSALELVVSNNYASLVVITVVGYDYFLTFSDEVQHIWRRPWTSVSTMFLVVRYIGTLSALTGALNGSSFTPGSLEVKLLPVFTSLVTEDTILIDVSRVLNLAGISTFFVFLSTTDFVMMLRVYTMWNRSRKILWITLFILVVQIVISIVVLALDYNPNHLSETIVPVSVLSFCNSSFFNIPPMINQLSIIPQLALAATLVVLAVIQTLKQSAEMYRATKQWQLNHYMQLLVRDGVLYFFVYVFYHFVSVLPVDASIVPNNTANLVLVTIGDVSLYPLIPRFIISIRALYDRDMHGRFHVDTGFGMRSQFMLDVGMDTMTMSAMVFDQAQQDSGAVEGNTESAGEIEEVPRVPGLASGLNEGSSHEGRDQGGEV